MFELSTFRFDKLGIKQETYWESEKRIPLPFYVEIFWLDLMQIASFDSMLCSIWISFAATASIFM